MRSAIVLIAAVTSFLTLGCTEAEFEKRRARCADLGGVLVLSTEAHSLRRDVCIPRDIVLGEF